MYRKTAQSTPSRRIKVHHLTLIDCQNVPVQSAAHIPATFFVLKLFYWETYVMLFVVPKLIIVQTVHMVHSLIYTCYASVISLHHYESDHNMNTSIIKLRVLQHKSKSGLKNFDILIWTASISSYFNTMPFLSGNGCNLTMFTQVV